MIYLCIAHELFHREIAHISVAPVYLHGVGHNTLQSIGGVELRHRGQLAGLTRIAAVEQLGDLQPEAARDLDLCGHICQHELYSLIFIYGLAEGDSLLRVLHRVFKGGAHEADRGGAGARAALIQGLHRDVKALAFAADYIRGGYFYIVEYYIRGV